MNAAEISQQLHGHRSGAGYVARCPAHDDKNPSLSLKDEDGKILVDCHAGCKQVAVVKALKARCQVVRLGPKRLLQRFPDRACGWIHVTYCASHCTSHYPNCCAPAEVRS